MWYCSSESGESSLNFSKPVLYPPDSCILLPSSRVSWKKVAAAVLCWAFLGQQLQVRYQQSSRTQLGQTFKGFLIRFLSSNLGLWYWNSIQSLLVYHQGCNCSVKSEKGFASFCSVENCKCVSNAVQECCNSRDTSCFTRVCSGIPQPPRWILNCFWYLTRIWFYLFLTNNLLQKVVSSTMRVRKQEK